MTCHVSNQIADYCNQEEVYCADCGGNMYVELGETTFTCSECNNEIETELDE